MTTIHTLVLIAHVLIGAGIIGLVLLQRGKGAEAGAAFGGGASGTVFGARGSANFLSRSTAVLATLFFATSLGLAYLSSQPTAPTSVLDDAAAVPAAPAVPPVPTTTGAAPAAAPGVPSLPGQPGSPAGAPAAPAAPAPAPAPPSTP